MISTGIVSRLQRAHFSFFFCKRVGVLRVGGGTDAGGWKMRRSGNIEEGEEEEEEEEEEEVCSV